MDTRRRKIDCKPELVISSLQKFYSTLPNIDEVIPYLNGTAELSLRLIDWFVTNYCRKHFIGYVLNGKEFLVYVSYKSQLKAYSKQYFDPNCRRERIMFQIPNYEPFLTTVGKLNFFRWAVESNLLEYIKEHYETIQNERMEVMKKSGRRSTQGTESSTASTESICSTLTTDSTATNFSTNQIQPTNMRTTRRKRSKQIPSASRQLQVHDVEIMVSFD
jgi:hypothetical protein